MEYENDQDVILTEEDLKGLDKPNNEGGCGAHEIVLEKKSVNNNDDLTLAMG